MTGFAGLPLLGICAANLTSFAGLSWMTPAQFTALAHPIAARVIAVVGNTRWHPAEKQPGVEVWAYSQYRSPNTHLVVRTSSEPTLRKDQSAYQDVAVLVASARRRGCVFRLNGWPCWGSCGQSSGGRLPGRYERWGQTYSRARLPTWACAH